MTVTFGTVTFGTVTSGLVAATLYLSASVAALGLWPPAVAANAPSIAPTIFAEDRSQLEPTWRHPVDAPIVDYFRPPSSRYGRGNRGLEYGTTRGQPVVAVADGKVVFAGQVGGQRFVVVTHGPALRSTYAYLERIHVAVGESVVSGQRLAAAASGFHLTARRHGVYVDPLLYLGRSWSVRLVSSRPPRHIAGPR